MPLDLARIRRAMRAGRIDDWLVTCEEGSDVNSEVLLGRRILGRHAIIIPASGKPLVVVGKMEETAVPAGFRKIAYSKYREFRAALSKELSGRRTIALDYVRRAFRKGTGSCDFLTHSEFLALRALLPRANLVPSKDLQLLRAMRSKGDVRDHRRAAQITGLALERVYSEGVVGKTELQIAARIAQVFSENGATEAFKSIVASGPASAEPHHEPTGRRVRLDEALLIDIGARFNLCCADVTRTIWTGRKPAEMFRKVYSTVLAAQAFSIRKIMPGVRGRDVSKVCDDVLASEFDRRHVLHSLGHSLGYVVHDVGPSLSLRETRRLEAGMLVTTEPGLYFPKKFGVRMEDDVLVGKKPENITAKIGRWKA